jgi:squalene-hopene/tetraprenyl-beta-curcumene cyclase
VLSGLEAIGEDLSQPYIGKAARWIKSRQNADGGWGESCESYHQSPSNTCAENSTPSQTAWALLALIAAGEASSREAHAGAGYLLRTQKADGSWDEEAFTGTGFPKHFYLRYDNYRNCFPLMALGRFTAGSRRKG